MLSKVIVVLVLGIVVGIEANCTPCMDAPKHYEELNCTGVKNRGDCCDSFYICPDSMYEHPLEKCQYLGKWYDINDKVDVSLLPSCISEAKCVSSSDGAKFQLVRESPVAIEDGCVAQYTLDNTCTPTKKVCGAAEKEKLHKCYHNKKMYHEGEVIKPTNFGPYFSTVCYKCLCDASYNNNTAPIMNENCRKIQCGMELLNADKFRDGCVPVYQKINVNDIEPTTCEPVDFMCPKTNPRETYTPSPTVPPRTCAFDDKVIAVRDTFETSHKCRTCKCLTPPTLTCIQTETC